MFRILKWIAPAMLLSAAMSSSVSAQVPCANCGDYGGGVHNAIHRVSPLYPAVGMPACIYRGYAEQDLFHQYYSPSACGEVPAQLYVAPRPVPPHVGHVYYTYQPLAPHEMLYPHSRTYHRYYDDGRGLTRTKVTWMR